eukprot:TRINITY_DN222_c0_g2_i1.p1 TRINITY_DN222_c0_g2~~TRINITY_DN222_c0_g2_i1.p1  ORF type:complete len:155 (-),score=28.61 TRINITY_DN222_c0_g2_i1:633-1097(-)
MEGLEVKPQSENVLRKAGQTVKVVKEHNRHLLFKIPEASLLCGNFGLPCCASEEASKRLYIQTQDTRLEWNDVLDFYCCTLCHRVYDGTGVLYYDSPFMQQLIPIDLGVCKFVCLNDTCFQVLPWRCACVCFVDDPAGLVADIQEKKAACVKMT